MCASCLLRRTSPHTFTASCTCHRSRPTPTPVLYLNQLSDTRWTWRTGRAQGTQPRLHMRRPLPRRPFTFLSAHFHWQRHNFLFRLASFWLRVRDWNVIFGLAACSDSPEYFHTKTLKSARVIFYSRGLGCSSAPEMVEHFKPGWIMSQLWDYSTAAHPQNLDATTTKHGQKSRGFVWDAHYMDFNIKSL